MERDATSMPRSAISPASVYLARRNHARYRAFRNVAVRQREHNPIRIHLKRSQPAQIPGLAWAFTSSIPAVIFVLDYIAENADREIFPADDAATFADRHPGLWNEQ